MFAHVVPSLPSRWKDGGGDSSTQEQCLNSGLPPCSLGLFHTKQSTANPVPTDSPCLQRRGRNGLGKHRTPRLSLNVCGVWVWPLQPPPLHRSQALYVWWPLPVSQWGAVMSDLVCPHPCLMCVDLLHVTSRHSPWVSTHRVRYYSHLEMI